MRATATTYQGRPLTDFERRMRADHRCVVCGVKVKAHWFSKREGDKRKWWALWPFECADCSRTQNRHTCQPVWGAGPASIHHEALRRTGYSPVGPGLDMVPTGEDDE